MEIVNSTACRYTADETGHLLHLARTGDQDALGRLLVSCMPQLYRVALRVLRNTEDAEDALQDGLLSAVCHFREFEGRCQFYTWLNSHCPQCSPDALAQEPATNVHLD
jgi:RNA polymerase sigma factor (sigma-70 family)